MKKLVEDRLILTNQTFTRAFADRERDSQKVTANLCHGRHHPKYQQIEMFEEYQYLLMPDEVKEFQTSEPSS